MHATLVAVTRSPAAAVSLRYAVDKIPEAWVLPEGTVPQSIPHDTVAEYLKLVLLAWAARTSRPVKIARDLAIRWLEQMPQIGIDPDVCVLQPPPPGAEDLASLCLWKPGHYSPPLCIEVVSANHPHKDYASIQDRYALIGTRELVVFDPLLVGPPSLGGPVALQLWRRDELGIFERVHFADEPVYSRVLEGWLVPRDRLLCIADDPRGERLWLTGEESERAEKERERAEKERERAEKERERAARQDLERRVRELEDRAARQRD
jgi:hypothetical protein